MATTNEHAVAPLAEYQLIATLRTRHTQLFHDVPIIAVYENKDLTFQNIMDTMLGSKVRTEELDKALNRSDKSSSILDRLWPQVKITLRLLLRR